MIHHMYPITEMPFDAYCVLLDHYSDMLDKYVPSKMEEDLLTGDVRALVYWYPRLVQNLYNLAYDGHDFRGYLESLNTYNVDFFEDIYKETVKKLDSLRIKRSNQNHLEEIKVKNGKII